MFKSSQCLIIRSLFLLYRRERSPAQHKLTRPHSVILPNRQVSTSSFTAPMDNRSKRAKLLRWCQIMTDSYEVSFRFSLIFIIKLILLLRMSLSITLERVFQMDSHSALSFTISFLTKFHTIPSPTKHRYPTTFFI